MTVFALKYLHDISDAINDLDSCLIDIENYEMFSTDFALKRVAERQFEIIGEALRKYNSIEGVVKIEDAKKIIGLRNIIAHAYDSIDYALIWAIIKRDLPFLKTEVDNIIKTS